MDVHLPQLQKLRGLLEIAEVGDIARRYAAMNAFDGILTIMGVLVGSYSAHIREPRVVLTTGLATAIAVGISGLWGAYLTETAERKRSLAELGTLVLTDLRKTRLGRASQAAVIVVALVDGLSPLIASLCVLLPFMLAPLLPPAAPLYAVALGIALAGLFGLGAYLGTISREHLMVAGLKTVGAGVVCVAINLLLGAH